MSDTLFEKIYLTALKKAEAFALWHLPGASMAKLIVQYSQTTHQWLKGSEGFVFHPFVPSANCPIIFIKPEEEISIRVNLIPNLMVAGIPTFLPLLKKQQSTNKSDYIHYIQQSIDAITNKQFNKTVAARALSISIHKSISPLALFKNLCQNYPLAFVSLVYSRQSGVWCGATPEILLRNLNGKLQTMALAGTVSLDKNREWSEKEKQEQQFVRTFIEEAFQQLKITPSISATQELLAGNTLKHLVSYFEAKLPIGNNFNLLQAMINSLHPTPAVGGLPKQKATEWILSHEPLNRLYYSGYLGPVHADDSFELYVNIRCMQWLVQEIILYAGAGITSQSNPENEWEETQQKMHTIGSAIQNLKRY